MKKMVSFIISLILILAISGCYTTVAKADEGNNVYVIVGSDVTINSRGSSNDESEFDDETSDDNIKLSNYPPLQIPLVICGTFAYNLINSIKSEVKDIFKDITKDLIKESCKKVLNKLKGTENKKNENKRN